MARKILIKWNRPNLYRCGDFRVTPGVNEVRQEVWDAVKDNPGVVQRVKDGLLSFVDAPLPPAEPKAPEEKDEAPAAAGKPESYSLHEYNAKQAVEIVKETLDLETLKAWEADEDRKTVLDAIEAQIDLVTIKKKDSKKDSKKDAGEGDED